MMISSDFEGSSKVIAKNQFVHLIVEVHHVFGQIFTDTTLHTIEKKEWIVK